MKFTEEQLQRAAHAARKAWAEFEGIAGVTQHFRHVALSVLGAVDPAPTRPISIDQRNAAVEAAKRFVGSNCYASDVVIEAAVDAALNTLEHGTLGDTIPAPVECPLDRAEKTLESLVQLVSR